MRTSLAATVLVLGLLPTAAALAGGESGFYIGGGLGPGTVKADGAKAGMFRWDSDLKASGISDSNSDTDAAYGMGARVQILSVTGRVAFEYFDVGEVDGAYLVSVCALYTFQVAEAPP